MYYTEKKKILLSEEDERAFLETFTAEGDGALRPAMLVIPGGAYREVCFRREGDPVAAAYRDAGFQSFVLHYRVGEPRDTYPFQMIDAGRAMLFIRSHAAEYGIDPARVFVTGFSAGGHLAACLGILPCEPEAEAALGVSGEEIRPRGIVLGYPVTTAIAPTHENSFRNLLGKEFSLLTEEEKRRFSVETRVDGKSAPAFIFHTAEDGAVPPVGSLRLAEAYVRAHRPVRLALYPYGPHGISLATGVTARSATSGDIQPLAARWLADATEFLRTV